MVKLVSLSVLLLLPFAGISLWADQTTYFPPGKEAWYPSYLRAMHEPSLYGALKADGVEEYRFLWLRTFHNPIAIRVTKGPGGAKMRAVRLSGAGGYNPGEIAEEKQTSLSALQFSHLKDLINRAEFWGPSQKGKSQKSGMDGSQWIFEGRINGDYRMTDFWTPEDDAAKRGLELYVSLGKYFIELSEFVIPPKELY